MRQFAVNTALNAEGVTAENFIEFAKSIEEYVAGSAPLPEYSDDSIQRLTEMITSTAFATGQFNPFNKIGNEDAQKEDAGEADPAGSAE